MVGEGNFRLILSMSVQVFYHLCRLNFLDSKDDNILLFTKKASPISRKADQGVYVTTDKALFLEVCGRLYHHHSIPIIPIVHVKQWPLKARTIRYNSAMELAKCEIRKGINILIKRSINAGKSSR